LHALVCLLAKRDQRFGTFFLRNRPELELMRRLAERNPGDSPLRISVLGCSIGAEVYSILWAMRSGIPEVKVAMCAVDISPEILAFAERGAYTVAASQRVGAAIFERLTESERSGMFDWEGERATIKACLKQGISWHLGDAADPELVRQLGPQDMVVASNFLCHMVPVEAERCLRNIARLVRPGGHLFISGVDLDVRTKVARNLGWTPVPDLLEEIHQGDPCMSRDWPWEYWGLEPMNKKRADWLRRYAAAFQANRPGPSN
jgi:SAM-dependent methyltransferase